MKKNINWVGKTIKELYDCSSDDSVILFTDGSCYSFYHRKYPDGTIRSLVIYETKICNYCEEAEFE